MLAHGAEGALGVVLNRPTGTRADELVPGWGERVVAAGASCSSVARSGQNGVIGLHPGGTIDLNVPPEETLDPPATLRLFAGSAGWGAGQLEEELTEGAWWVLDAEPDDAFVSDPGRPLDRRPPPPARHHRLVRPPPPRSDRRTDSLP